MTTKEVLKIYSESIIDENQMIAVLSKYQGYPITAEIKTPSFKVSLSSKKFYLVEGSFTLHAEGGNLEIPFSEIVKFLVANPEDPDGVQMVLKDGTQILIE